MSKHIDDWLDNPNLNCSQEEAYARFILDYFRLSSWKQNLYKPFMQGFDLYCKYNNVKYRVTGASRLGDIHLNSDLYATSGYTLRVDVTKCTDWSSS